MRAKLWRLLLAFSFIIPIVFGIYFWREAGFAWPPPGIVVDKAGYPSLASFFSLMAASLVIRLFKAPRDEASSILKRTAQILILISIAALTLVSIAYWWLMGGLARPPPPDAILRKVVGRRPLIMGVLISMLFSAVAGYAAMRPEQRRALNRSIRILAAAALTFSPAYIQWLLLSGHVQAFIRLGLHQAQAVAFILLIVGMGLLTWTLKGLPPRLSENVKLLYGRISRALRRALRAKDMRGARPRT